MASGGGKQRPSLASGAVIQQRYEVVRLLGSGGMAAAYLVRDRLWDTEVALKLLRADTPELLDALHFEFAALRELYHPHLCQVHDFSPIEAGGRECYYTADYVPGATLQKKAKRATWKELRRPLCDALSALRLLHRAGIRHGDFKPGNVLVRPDGRGVLIDLGCARPIAALPSATVSGTRGFLAPELLAGEAADSRADLFAVGTTLLKLGEAVSGGSPRGIERLAKRLVRERAAERPADVDEVLEALGEEPSLQVAVPDGIGRLAGRSKQLAQAEAALSALASGAPGARVVHVVGGDGMGKSRLLREIAWLAAQRCRVVEANAAGARAVEELLARAGAPSDTGGLSAIVALRERSHDAAWPSAVLLVDDAHRLAPSQMELLRALAEGVEDTDRLLVVVASPSEFELGGSGLRLRLGPLEAADVDAWVGTSLGPRTRKALHALSGGVPAALREVLAQLASGAITEQELRQKTGRVALSVRRRKTVAALDASAQRGLAALAVLGQTASGETLSELGVDRSALENLMRCGLVARDAAGFKLGCWGEGGDVLQALGAALVQAMHDDLASWLERQLLSRRAGAAGRSELEARIVEHLALGERPEEARARLLDASGAHDTAPVAWWRAGEALAKALDDPEVQLLAAALERGAGRAREARARINELGREQPPPQLRARLQLELGRCELMLGDGARAQARLQQAADAAPTMDVRAQALHVLAQALNNQGRYRDALQVADQALAHDLDPMVSADLQQAAGVALSFLGQLEPAQARLSQAASLLKGTPQPRRLVRTLGTQGLVEYQLGSLAAAADHYGQALELAERHGLSDQIATAALNLGTVCHQRGDWGSALGAYERGMMTAAALGQTSTEALLRFDLAKLHADLGQFERAELGVARCQEAAQRAQLPLIHAEAETVSAEVRMARGDHEGARACFARARAQFDKHESLRERAEVDIQLAELQLEAGQVEAGALALRELGAEVEQLEARDVKLRWALACARAQAARGEHREAAEAAETAAVEARDIELADVAGDAELCAAGAWEAQGSPFLAHQHRARAREIWERAAAQLSSSARDAFWKHPRRAGALTIEEPSTTMGGSGREQKLALLLDINQRLNSTLKTSEILERTMDAAIQLTGAERGFVLLADGHRGRGRLRVAVARNLDREQLGKSHLKFSRAIAEQVIDDGTPVITANAQVDSRFSQNESVHAMQLQSVVCVPVVSPSGTLGALYLDNRFQPGRFRQQDIDLLLAFSVQVAIALVNARLHDELRQRNRELSRERQRVEELLEGQAAEIERLNEQVRRGLALPDQRYDYRGIVGSSPAVRQVFALLDRVIETDLPILIQGESGTGKELFARAIHHNNAPRTGELVSVNCAALPETLLESELFGYERGAFTGADRSREGLFVKARGGTLFLDEVAEMPLPMQVKLLRALQEREVRPLGSHKVIPIDIRLVCATNRNLQEAVDAGGFRADLYYRIAGVELTLPPLRDRSEDIPVLVHHLVKNAADRMGRAAPELTPSALGKLAKFAWPGNVRQLDNVVTKALVMCEGTRITAVDIELPDEVARAASGMDRATFQEREAEQIAEALAQNRWNVAKVSRLLGIPRPTLYRKLRRYGLARGSD